MKPATPPQEWTCSAALYGDYACDCGCGVVDVDCKDATAASCEFTSACGGASKVVPANNAKCINSAASLDV